MLAVTSSLALAYALGGAPAPHCRAPSARTDHVFMQENLKCDVRKLPKSAIALDITVPKAVADEIHLKTLQGLAKNAQMSGFRDGKVPPQAVIAKLGLQKVKEATVEQIVDVGMQQSGVGQKVQTVGEVRLPEELDNVAKRYTVGEELSFSVEVDIFPQLVMEEDIYKGLTVDVEKPEFNQDGYDAALKKLRKQHCDVIDQEAGVAAEDGDQVVVNMEGFLANADGTKGEPLPALAGGDGVTVPLEPGKFMPGLVEGLIGATKGEKREIKVSFPSRSSAPQVRARPIACCPLKPILTPPAPTACVPLPPAPLIACWAHPRAPPPPAPKRVQLAGKEAVFEVDVLNVQQRMMPEIGDEFAQRVKPDMDWAELDSKLREGVQQDAEDRFKENAHMALEKALIQVVPETFELPETMVEDDAKQRFAMMLGCAHATSIPLATGHGTPAPCPPPCTHTNARPAPRPSPWL